MNLNYEQIGKRIRKMRKDCGMTQGMLAEAVGISNPHMSNIETGKTKLSLPLLAGIANALGTTLDSLACDSLQYGGYIFEGEIVEELKKCSAEERRFMSRFIRINVKNFRETGIWEKD